LELELEPLHVEPLFTTEIQSAHPRPERLDPSDGELHAPSAEPAVKIRLSDAILEGGLEEILSVVQKITPETKREINESMDVLPLAAKPVASERREQSEPFELELNRFRVEPLESFKAWSLAQNLLILTRRLPPTRQSRSGPELNLRWNRAWKRFSLSRRMSH
jgi:hypothetical protein